MRRLGHRAIDLLVDRLVSLGEGRVAGRGSAADFAALVDEPLPRAGLGAEASLDAFFQRVAPGMTKLDHPRFFGFIPSASSFYSVLGKLLDAGANPFVGSWLGGATVASLELTVLRWIAEAVGYDPAAAGLFTSGGSIANLCALAAARATFGSRAAHGAAGTARALGGAEAGSAGTPRLPAGYDLRARATIYASEQGHGSFEKAALLLGYPPSALRRVPVDCRFRMRVDALATQIADDRGAGLLPLAVSANAGTTNTGSIDPLPEIADLCAAQGIWLHVDAAYGGFAAICAEGRRKLAGMERADSLTLDPHKWLYAPMGTGCVLVRDRAALESAFRVSGDYLKDVPRAEVNFFDRGPEMSRPGRVLAVWTLLRSAGLDAIAEQVEWDLRLARLAEELLGAVPELEIVVPAELSVVTFRSRARPGETEAARAARDSAIMERTLASGELMISSTDLAGRTALRLVVLNHRTTQDEIRRSVAAIARAAGTSA
ncbi:MAG TPA: aminotransferase class V-fold PLP-dependent enzyme [Thermoanaerobaculia bacterium]|nr:aminotransferase class V-fold PLP-dependent enzyme [Thermoanaerobaculia bacterium]